MPTWLEQNAAALVGHALTVIGLIVGAVTVVCQLGRQHKNSLALQKENCREELKLRVFEILVKRTRSLTHASVEAGLYAIQIPIHLDIYRYQCSLGISPMPVTDRADEFLRLHAQFGSALVELIEEFESWAIAFPGLHIFQVALNAASHDERGAFSRLHSALLPALPVDLPMDSNSNKCTPFLQPPLSDQAYLELQTLVANYKEAVDEAACYVHDLVIEAQNNLLSGLFEHRVPRRKPLDPSCKVISTEPENVRQLLRHFEHDSAWGKAKANTEAEVIAQLNSAQQS